MIDWRQERDEYIAGRLIDGDEQRDWEAQRDVDLGHDVGWVSTDEMVETWARERRKVEDRSELEHIAEKALIAQWWRDLHDREDNE